MNIVVIATMVDDGHAFFAAVVYQEIQGEMCQSFHPFVSERSLVEYARTMCDIWRASRQAYEVREINL